MTTLNDLINNINADFPYAKVDNSSQGFRDNFHYIKYALTNINENPFQLPMASNGLLGGVKVGFGLSISSYTGVLSVNQTIASSTTLGFIKIGPGLSTNTSTGITTLTPATSLVIGGVKSDGSTVAVSGGGVISATGYFTGPIFGGTITSTGDGNFAGAGTFGSDINVTGNVQSHDGIFNGNVYGGAARFSSDLYARLQSGAPTGYVVNFNTLTDQLLYVPETITSISTATTSTLGSVKIGAGVDITSDGTISVNTGTPYTLPLATYSSLGGVIIGSGLAIDGNGIVRAVNPGFDGGLINQPLLIDNYTQSYSTLSGALVVQGGAGIAKTLWVGEVSVLRNTFVGGQLFVQSSTSSTSATSGALVVNGGMGVGGDLHVRGSIYGAQVTLQETVFTTGSVVTSAVMQTTNNTPSTSTQTGALIIEGGAGIGQNLFVGGGAVIWGDIISLNGYFIGPRLEIPNTTIASTFFQTTQILEVFTTTQSVSTITGAIVVKGGVGIGGNVYAGNIYSNGVQLSNYNTGTLVATSVFAQTFNTGTLVATSVFAQTFNTGTLVTNSVRASTATNAAFAYSFNTGTLITTAVTAVNQSGGTVNATTAQFSSTATITNVADSVSTQSGALQVAGGVGVGGNVVLAGYLKSIPTTVAALPSASAVGAGARAFVTDSTTVTSFLAIVVGGGVESVPVVSNGSSWLVG